jgi:DNA polymerase-4
MGDRPVTAVWGIGDRTAAHLAELGIETVTDLARADHDALARRFGPRIGPSLRVMGLGGADDPVVGEPYVPKSRSKEVTFEHDVRARPEIEAHVARLGGEVTESVVADGRRVTHVAVKVRTAAFFTTSRIRKLPEPTTEPDVVATTALGMLDLFDAIERERPIRLLGVRVMLEPLP